MKFNNMNKKAKIIQVAFSVAVFAYTIYTIIPKFDVIQNVDEVKLIDTIKKTKENKFINN